MQTGEFNLAGAISGYLVDGQGMAICDNTPLVLMSKSLHREKGLEKNRLIVLDKTTTRGD